MLRITGQKLIDFGNADCTGVNPMRVEVTAYGKLHGGEVKILVDTCRCGQGCGGLETLPALGMCFHHYENLVNYINSSVIDYAEGDVD